MSPQTGTRAKLFSRGSTASNTAPPTFSNWRLSVRRVQALHERNPARALLPRRFRLRPRPLRRRLEVQHGGGYPQLPGSVHGVHPQDRTPAAVAVDAEVVPEESQLAQIVRALVQLVMGERPTAIDAARQGHVGEGALARATVVVSDVDRA